MTGLRSDSGRTLMSAETGLRAPKCIVGETTEDEAIQDASSIAPMRTRCLPGKARKAVATAAIAANTQADRKT
jgi:hypothetical protein